MVLGHVDVGPRVAVIGAGGVGVDVAEALAAGTERPDGTPETQEHWLARRLRGQGHAPAGPPV
ncbi:hypothetical protein, partial [Micrococcus sp. F3Y]|uniref:hypothetical protein n=1 Tax=Micrococcus sp. F3Y TaxID=3402627 RepID=UPI003AF42CCB